MSTVVATTGTKAKAGVAVLVKTNGITGERTLYVPALPPTPWWAFRFRRKLRAHVAAMVAEKKADVVMVDSPRGWRPYR